MQYLVLKIWKENQKKFCNELCGENSITGSIIYFSITGNDNLLRCDALWEKYLHFCKSKGQVVDGRQYLKWLN